jgi:hypothetical protein
MFLIFSVPGITNECLVMIVVREEEEVEKRCFMLSIFHYCVDKILLPVSIVY